MKIYEINALDCSIKENRKELVRAVKIALKLEDKPSVEYLGKMSAKLGEKYKMPIQLMQQIGNFLMVSVAVENGTYSSLRCLTYYEAFCKHILLIQEYVKYKKQKVK